MQLVWLLLPLVCSAAVARPAKQKRDVTEDDFLQRLLYNRQAMRNFDGDGQLDKTNLYKMMLRSAKCANAGCREAYLRASLGPLSAGDQDLWHSFNTSGDYVAGMNVWRNLNLSGRREVPFYVEEPQFIIVRREREDDDDDDQASSNLGLDYNDDPFIPPRGRKHILDELVNRVDLFVPNRGKRDKIRDIFKYDDLFIPNRGKKRMPQPAMIDATPSPLPGNGRTRGNCLTRDYANNDNGHGYGSSGGGRGGNGCANDDIQTNGNDQSVNAEIHEINQAMGLSDYAGSAKRRSDSVSAISTHKLPRSQKWPQPPISSEQWADYYS